MELINKDITTISNEVSDAIIVLLQDMSNTVSKDTAFIVALSGGNSPKELLQIVAEKMPMAIARRLKLIQVDERIVDPQHSDSNQKMILESCDALLTKGAQFFPMDVSQDTVVVSYQKLMTEFFHNETYIPAIALLGMGTDGHTASIFPKSKEHTAPSKSQYVFQTEKEYLGYHRVSLTYYTLHQFKHLIFYVPGIDKATMVAQATVEENKDKYPVTSILLGHANSRFDTSK